MTLSGGGSRGSPAATGVDSSSPRRSSNSSLEASASSTEATSQVRPDTGWAYPGAWPASEH